MLQVKIKDDTGNTIGQNIRRIRKSRNIGQTALVRDLQLLDIDMTREALVKIERGIQHIQLSQLKGIRDVLQTTYDELMLSRLVDTFFSRTSWTMLLYAENHSISVA